MRVESGERALATARGWPRETMMGGERLPPAPCLDDTVLGRRFSTVCTSSRHRLEGKASTQRIPWAICRVCEDVPS